jgi:integrase
MPPTIHATAQAGDRRKPRDPRRTKLTQLAVDHLKPLGERVDYWDTQLPGFGVRVSEAGRKTWIAMYRADGKSVRETLGTVALIPNVADARARARESMQKAREGVNPVEQRRGAARAAEIAAERAPASTFAAVADRYMKIHHIEKKTRLATAKETSRVIEHDVKPKWGARPIAEITRKDIDELLDGIAGRGAWVQANRTLAQLKTLFRWALGKDLIADDPTARVSRRVKETARDRVLSDDEIRWFWSGREAAGWPFGPLFQLLLLTAQRRDEVGSLEWNEVNLEKQLWTIPRERTKNDRAHEAHFSALTVEIIEGLPKVGSAGRLVFSTNGARPVSGFSRAKAALDRRMAELAGATPIAGWILHDLRRTATTEMAKLNILPHVVDRILNHVSGTIRGVAAVYNRYGYLNERKAALDAWGKHIEGLV